MKTSLEGHSESLNVQQHPRRVFASWMLICSGIGFTMSACLMLFGVFVGYDLRTVEPMARLDQQNWKIGNMWPWMLTASLHTKRLYITLTITTFSGQDYIKIPAFYHEQWVPDYPNFAHFHYDRASYHIRLRQHRGKLFFADGLKHLRKYLDIYESVTINFMACKHRWIFNLHFTPPLEQQACGRPLLATRMHVWTLELTQALLGDPQPLKLPPLAAIHLPSCGFHMTALHCNGQSFRLPLAFMASMLPNHGTSFLLKVILFMETSFHSTTSPLTIFGKQLLENREIGVPIMIRSPIISCPLILQFRVVFHCDRPDYPKFVQFKYDGATYEIQLRQHKGKCYFADELTRFRKELEIYESITINFLAYDHLSIFNLHFTPPIDQQTCRRPCCSSRKHIWTLTITQCMLVIDDEINDKYVVQPCYQFFEERDFNHGDEISLCYRRIDKISEIVIRRQKNWDDNHTETMATQFLKSLLLLSTLTLTISAEYTGFVGTIDPKSIGIKHKKTLSHFRFYWHEVFSGENPTSVRIIPALPKYNTTTTFGSVGIFDNALTVGPEVYSKVVGKAEGLFASTSQTQLDLLLIFNFALTQGKYNGSTITFTGRSPLSEKEQAILCRVMTCSPDKIKSIDGLRETLKLAIRITDLWFIGIPSKFEQAKMIIVDSNGDKIHVVCKQDQLKSWKADLKENSTYVMHNFKVLKNDEYTGFVGTLDPKSIGIKHKKTLSHFRFYWHEVFTGENPTAVRIIPSLPKYNTTTFFGTLGVYDNALTVGPEAYSKVVGKAEGLFASTSQTQVDILQIFNFALTQGKYNGSTITFAGRMSQSEKVRELPIVGGSGVFKFATGYMETSSLSFDPQTRDNTFQFDVYIYY
ncbi:Dirigent protein 3 [Glycine soja]